MTTPIQENSRVTLDIPRRLHKKLKTIAALSGRSMREIITEMIDQYSPVLDENECPYKNCGVFNKETLKSLCEGPCEDDIRADSVREAVRKMGF